MLFTQTPTERFRSLSPIQQALIIHYVGQDLTEVGLALTFDLMDQGIIEFTEVNTANEHLHVRHPRSESPKWCTLCTRIQMGEAA
jgi:hypothetical protein